MTKDEETTFEASRHLNDIEYHTEALKEIRKKLKAVQDDCSHNQMHDNRCDICFKKI